MNKKYKGKTTNCEWCGEIFEYRVKKKFCCDSCRAFYWKNKPQKKERKERKKVLGYIKRRKDVNQFSDYLNLIKRYNKLYSTHLTSAFKGNKAKYLDVSYQMLKSDTPHKYSRQIDEILSELEKSL